MPPAVEVTALAKRFGHMLAIDNVNAVVEPGAAVALLGPNGAGKTTLLRLCANLLRPTGGTVRLFGLDPEADGHPARRRIGMLAHESFLYSDLSPVENLQFYARLYGVKDANGRIGALIDRLGLAGWAHRRVGTLSRGMLQRCTLARVMLHKPDLLFLDEPFTGLDVQGADLLLEVLAEAHRSGATLIMSTHNMARAYNLCSSSLVLVRGKLAWSGSILSSDRGEFEMRYQALIAAVLDPSIGTGPEAPLAAL